MTNKILFVLGITTFSLSFAAGPKPPAGLWSCTYTGIETSCDNFPSEGERHCLPQRFFESSSWQTLQSEAVAEAKRDCERRAINTSTCEFRGCKQSQ